jgi:hypothetical protein
MKKDSNIVYKGLASVGIFFLGKYLMDALVNAAYNRISYTFGRPNVDFRGLANFPPVIKVILPMTVINKNPIGVTITSFVGEMFYGNIKLSDIIIPQGENIPANGQATLTLNLNIQGTQVINDIVASLGQTGSYSTLVNVIKLKGVLETSMYRVPIETNLSLV